MFSTIGKELIYETLPKELRDIKEPLSKDKLDAILSLIVKDHPTKYKEISKKLMQLGANASFEEGITLNLSDTLADPSRNAWFDHVAKQRKKILSAPGTPKEKEEALNDLYHSVHGELVKETFDTALAKNNPFALQVQSKARGNKLQLTQLLTTPGVYQDADEKTIPLFIRHSYAEGLTPAEYWAAMYGARKGVISTKSSTAKGGYLGKQLNAAAANIVVTGDDCETLNGVPVITDDVDNIGAVLARDIGKFKAGTVIDRSILSVLKTNKVDNILVRSPITCGFDKGVCKQCTGIRDAGKFPNIGDYVGIQAASAVAERIAQSALNCLVKGTLVRMADFTVKAIEDIRVGDIVLGADIKGETFPIKVTHTWDQGLQSVNKYTYAVGGTKQRVYVICTADHPILSNTKKSSCIDAKNNFTLRKLNASYSCSLVAAVFPTNTVANGIVCEPFATLIGIWLGDGCRNCGSASKDGSGAPVISCAEELLSRDLKEHCQSLGLDFVKCKRSYDWRVPDRVITHSTGMGEKGYRNRFKRKLADINLLTKYAHEKCLPHTIWEWTTEDILRLIGGYLATDGSVYKTKEGMVGISWSSTSRKLLEELKELMAVRLCVYSGAISLMGHAGTQNRTHDIFGLCVTRGPEIEKLVKLLSSVYVPGGKIKKAQEYIGTGLSKHHGDFYRCKRIEIKPLGMEHCYDITVAHPDELFVLANGLIVKNSKHQGGQKHRGDEEDYVGFDLINQFAQVPENFQHQSTLATLDGKVTKVEPAVQGGTNVYINDQLHYILPKLAVHLKPGDDVEQGDQLSSGIMDPSEVVKYKGIGEGRRYFTDRFTKLLRDSGFTVQRRNIELLSRAMLNHVRPGMDVESDVLPGDVIGYNTFAYGYKPRPTSRNKSLDESHGEYLDQPALHYTIGTRLDNSAIKQLKAFNVNNVLVNKDPVDFEPFMPSLRVTPSYNPDWMAQLGSSYLESNLLKNVQRGATSSTKGLNPLPGIAKGVDFTIK